MVCGSTLRTCNRADSAFPRVALGIIVTLLGLSIIFQLFRFCASRGLLGRSLQAPAGATLVSQEEMSTMSHSSAISSSSKGGAQVDDDDNSVIDLDEPPARHRRPSNIAPSADIDD